ncbi:MAG TPA: hypothetical protein VMU30_10440 [Bacteroidota bacterium]|nr:hypothetical protein [Bacteroidota bacterium]
MNVPTVSMLSQFALVFGKAAVLIRHKAVLDGSTAPNTGRPALFIRKTAVLIRQMVPMTGRVAVLVGKTARVVRNTAVLIGKMAVLVGRTALGVFSVILEVFAAMQPAVGVEYFQPL